MEITPKYLPLASSYSLSSLYPYFHLPNWHLYLDIPQEPPTSKFIIPTYIQITPIVAEADIAHQHPLYSFSFNRRTFQF